MTYKHDLTIRINQTDDINLSLQFTDEEYELLKDFVNYADEVFQTNFVKNRNFGKLMSQSDGQNDLRFTTELPNRDETSFFIYKLRPIVLQNEGTHFHKIRKLLGLKIDNSDIRGFLKLQKEMFDGKRLRNFQILSDESILNSEKTLFDWLNAYEYHRDKDKQKLIENLHRIIPLEASKVLFLSLLLEKAKAIFNLADFIDLLTGKIKKLNLEAKSNN